MNIQEYVNQKKEIQTLLLDYIENESEGNDIFQNLINFIKSNGILKNQDELRLLLRLISKISKNHYRTLDFFKKIERILTQYKEDIKQNLTNADIFYIFKNNKRILLFLIKSNIIEVDQYMTKYIQKKNSIYFYPEIKNLIDESEREKIESQLLSIDPQIFDSFDQNRQIGENESYICELIRNDSVENFIAHITKNNISLKSKIKPSIFETNPFLVKRSPSLIKYAAFYGSIQIFQYLKLNKVQLKPSIWLFAIHGKNPEIIHLLEDDKIMPKDNSYDECLKESIKCHHNEIAKYIEINLMDENIKDENLKSNFSKNLFSYCFHYYNFEFFPDDYENDFIFFYSCKYDYFEFLKLLRKARQIDLNSENHYKIVNYLLENGIKLSPYLFENCSNLTQINLYPNIKTINQGLFEKCSLLTHITIPSSVKSIESQAFLNCSSIVEIEIPSSVKKIEDYTFSGCSSLQKISIPNTVSFIGDSAFFGCELIQEISIPNGVTSIKDLTFKGCKNLKKIILSNRLDSIGKSAFIECKLIVDISIPSSVTIINEGAFCKCHSLKEVNFSPDSNLKFIERAAFYDCKSLTQINIPSSVKKIGSSSFSCCTSLSKFIFEDPVSVTEVGSYAFYRCQKLEKIKIPSMVTIIERNTFWGCTSLAEVLVPSTLKYISNDAFEQFTKIIKYD